MHRNLDFCLCNYFPFFFHENLLLSPHNWDITWISAWIYSLRLQFFFISNKHLLHLTLAFIFKLTTLIALLHNSWHLLLPCTTRVFGRSGVWIYHWRYGPTMWRQMGRAGLCTGAIVIIDALPKTDEGKREGIISPLLFFRARVY